MVTRRYGAVGEAVGVAAANQRPSRAQRSWSLQQ